ncbi:hypothetical protein FIBSPDRAFT_930555 [Athelia psychrophila]|uniref:BTB domain-containing protein n=1 Tax=Athelia psychrophila TaxID=1759441 RepID=A0A166M062_9AGAM|nr:hypothetical protein FIBSPDRAFT_930555 [Fibularhizoctonia sp. CBS 109695]
MTSTSTLDPPTEETLGPVIRSDMWFEDGNIVLQAERTQFKVHRGTLVQNSSVFSDMLSFPQPPGPASMVEGCPVVQLSDSANDMTFVLKALFQRGFAPTGKPLEIEIVAAFLRLGKKYDIEVLRVEALERIFTEVPTTLDEMLYNGIKPTRLIAEGEAICYPYTNSFPWPAILNLAREHDLQSVIPLALYECCCLFDEASLYSYEEMAKLNISANDQVVIAAAAKCMVELQNETTFSWTGAQSEMLGLCPTPELCARDVLHILRQEFLVGVHIRGTEPWKYSSSRFCEHCRINGEIEQSRGRQKFWDSLPELFGLNNWREVSPEREQLLAPQ